jgi:hypothetical protein
LRDTRNSVLQTTGSRRLQDRCTVSLASLDAGFSPWKSITSHHQPPMQSVSLRFPYDAAARTLIEGRSASQPHVSRTTYLIGQALWHEPNIWCCWPVLGHITMIHGDGPDSADLVCRRWWAQLLPFKQSKTLLSGRWSSASFSCLQFAALCRLFLLYPLISPRCK